MAQIRANALLWKPPTVKFAVHDGDTYWMLVDLKNNGFRAGAEVCDIRLFGYSAKEIGQAADADRVSGTEARQIAEQILVSMGSEIEVDLKGRDKYGRDLASVYIAGDDFGLILASRRAVIAGSFKGLHGPEFAIYDELDS